MRLRDFVYKTIAFKLFLGILGKSLHDETENETLVDLNRCGSGLIEIVFGPDLFHGEEAASLVKELSLILRKLQVCNCQME